ncbi:TetR/AcrR family transcriptional regulator [Hydrocarboniphaga sp.]|uniref:TetR/AcrR family transcriptional regulator n=1 Tax=Hydrocarboniphaga sp. TaxID=2033016 RepID=UPI003D150F6E
MASPRRIGVESSATRSALLDAAEQIMMEEGYAAVSSRRVASRAGLKPQLVHYYFRAMDDLFLALIRRGAERSVEQMSRIVGSKQPLRALWEFSSRPEAARLAIEYVALANHRKAIGAEMARHAEQLRQLETAMIAGLLSRQGLAAGELPPVSLALLISGLSRVLVMESALGMRSGHAETLALVERHLGQLEAGRVSDRKPPESRQN